MTETLPAVEPLTARSVVLSLLLGSHPRPLAPAELARASELFGIPRATSRVALSRAVSAGEAVRDDAGYRLGPRLLQRQARQDEAVAPQVVPWRGEWETAVVVVTGRSGPDRTRLRDVLSRHRLAELREGVWMRPANLARRAGYRDEAVLQTFRATPEGAPDALAARLWDLAGWAATGHRLLRAHAAAQAHPDRFLTAAQLVRHLATDPILPAGLLPGGWPGAALREAYAGYRAELATLALGSA